MKKLSLIKFYQLLSNLKTDKTLNIKFAYAIQRNLSKIQLEIDALIEVKKTLTNERVVAINWIHININKKFC